MFFERGQENINRLQKILDSGRLRNVRDRDGGTYWAYSSNSGDRLRWYLCFDGESLASGGLTMIESVWAFKERDFASQYFLRDGIPYKESKVVIPRVWLDYLNGRNVAFAPPAEFRFDAKEYPERGKVANQIVLNKGLDFQLYLIESQIKGNG